MARRINLLPPSERPRTTTDFALLGVVALAIVVLFGLGLSYYLLSNRLDDRKREYADLQQETRLVEAQVAVLSQYDLIASEREKAESVVQRVYAARTPVADILDAISFVTPESVWFKSLEVTTADPTSSAAASQTQGDSTIALEGKTYTFEDVAQVLVRLQLIPALSEVQLKDASVEEGGHVTTFSVEAKVVNTQDPATPLPMSKVEVEGL